MGSFVVDAAAMDVYIARSTDAYSLVAQEVSLNPAKPDGCQ